MTQCECESWWVGYVWHQVGTKTQEMLNVTSLLKLAQMLWVRVGEWVMLSWAVLVAGW